MHTKLWQNIDAIADSEALMKRLAKYVSKLVKEKEDPTLMTKEEFYAKIERAERQAERGEGMRMLHGEDLVSNLKRILDKVYRWFPSFKRFLNMERECLQCGFNVEQTDKLLQGQRINYSGWLHSNEYRRNALANNVTAQVIRDEKRNLFIHINKTPIAQWFKEQNGLGQSETQKKGIRR